MVGGGTGVLVSGGIGVLVSGTGVLVFGGIGVLVSGIGVFGGIGVRVLVGLGVLVIVGCGMGVFVDGMNVLVGCGVAVLGAMDVLVGSGVAVPSILWQSGSALSASLSASSSTVLKQYSRPGSYEMGPVDGISQTMIESKRICASMLSMVSTNKPTSPLAYSASLTRAMNRSLMKSRKFEPYVSARNVSLDSRPRIRSSVPSLRVSSPSAELLRKYQAWLTGDTMKA